MDRRDLSKVLLGSAAGVALPGESAKAQSGVAQNFAQTAAEGAARVAPTNSVYPPGSLLRYKTGSLAVDADNDWSPALQAACDQCMTGGVEVIIPGTTGFYRCNKAITLPKGCRITSEGTQPTLRFYGCHGFVLAHACANLNVSGVELFSLTSDGKVDPKKYNGITVKGAKGATCNYIFLKDLYMRGWDRCIDLCWTWNSTIDNCTTLNCNIGVRLYGQSVSNSIINCRLGANTGTHSIKCEKDVAIRGEGLTIANSLLAMGSYGLQADGFLSLNIVNSVIDQIGDTGIDVTNGQALVVSNCWIYAANHGVRWRDLSVLSDQGATISSCRVETTAANSKALFVGANNQGISVSGGSLTCSSRGTSHCLSTHATSNHISVVGTHLDNPGTSPSVYAGAPGFRHAAMTGAVSIQYAAPDQYTGALTQCTTAPTTQIIYSVTGDIVTLQIPSLTAISANANQPVITGMPAAIWPRVQQFVAGHIMNNGLPVIGMIAVGTNGDLALYNGAASVFTAANSKGVNPCTITYRRV